LDTPGFYAEPGPLAAVMQANRAVAQSVEATGRQISAALAALPKPQQDELVHRNVVANIHLSALPTLVATIRRTGQSAASIAAAIAGSENDVTLAVPTSTAPVSITRASGGFLSISLPAVVGG